MAQRTTAQKLLTYALLAPLIVASTAFFGIISLITSLWDKSGRQQHAIAQVWAKSLLMISFSPMQVIGKEKLGRVAVYASNHISYMDTPALFGNLPFQFRILANHYLFKIPFIGWHLKRSGQVPIDQSNLRSQIAGLNKGIATLKSGMPILLFPEAGRSQDGHIKSMLSGAAFMAIKAQVPIMPLALVGTHELMPMHEYSLAPRPLKLVVGDPIDTTGLTTKDAEVVTKKLADAITEMYYAHSELKVLA
ncbi:lysophospholipid acyltransferase family protein [Terriglobus tenax]|uniref:lysophospholipid acyltransferase family protein n=1 Tax=Terriglobus tenax TaxID=1111115 RepID=UPI0021DFD78C|nr:lysophospholipid acyltransferase family protein [Terriglobus tenax]